MHKTLLNRLGCFGVNGCLILTLAACAGSGSPTPPGLIGDTPPSIMDSQPPASDLAATDQPLSDLGSSPAGTDGLPPATSLSANAPASEYKAPASKAILTFEPMVGAPKTVARELSTSLGLRVAQHSLPVVARTDGKVTHRIKGYFSASQSGSDCVVSYVWDIFDANGKRINRVTGSQKTAMVSSDPWDSVKGPVLDQVAVDTAAKLKSWHASI